MKILIVGAGYVGAACAARWRADGHETREWTLTASGDCADAAAWKKFCFAPDALLFSPSTRGGDAAAYRRLYVDGLQMALRHAPPSAALLFTSSTSVYGQTDGSWVDETLPSAPVSERAKILLEAERLTVSVGGKVLRLSAIYGAGRMVLRDRLLDGTARLPADSQRFLNQIHQRDAVSAVDLLMHQPGISGEIFNVSDDAPATYREVFAWLCEKCQRPLPLTVSGDAPAKRGITNKRVSNQKLRALGWHPQFSSFREGYVSVCP